MLRAFSPKRSLFRFESDKVVPCCRAAFAVYLIASVSWRLSFCPRFTLSFKFRWFIILDLVCTSFFSFETFQLVRTATSSTKPSSILPSTHEPTEQEKIDGLGNSMLSCQRRETTIAWCNILFFVVSVAPLEYLAILFSKGNWVNYVMLNRLFLILFLPKYLSDLAQKYLKSIGVQRTWLLFFTMGMAAHLCACGFYYVAFQEATNGVTGTWPEAAGIWTVDNADHVETTLTMETSASEAYITSLYWACVTMITTGFGDIVPLQISETVWCIISMFVGVIITALTIANIQILVTSVDAPRLNFQRKMEMINKYMRYRKLPKALQDRVLAFYDYQWTMLKGTNEAEFFDELPQTLQQQVTNFMCRDIIASLPILRRANTALLNALVECSEMNVYSPKDCIIKRGEKCNGALLISHGEVEVLRDDVVERKMKRLDRFAEECLFIDKVASHTIRSKGFSEVVILPRDEFQKCLASQCDEDQIAKMRSTAIALSQDATKMKANKLFGSADEFTPSGVRRHFHPSSLSRKIWDCVVLFGLIFYSFSIPLSCMYVVKNTQFSETPILLSLGYVVDLFFLVDVILQWKYFMYLDEGLLVYDKMHIREKFYKQRNPTRELLGVIPFDLISCFLHGRYCHYFRLLKIVRLPNISMYKETVDVIFNELNVDIDLVLYRVFKLNLFMVLVSHWVGCLWFMMGTLSRVGYSENWLDADESNPSLSISHSDYCGFAAYLRSVYWAVVGMSTVGYGDIVPTNILETFYATIVILFGGLLLPAIVGGLAAYMSGFHRTEKLFRKRIAKVRQYLLKIDVEKSLLEKCRRYFDYHWSRQGGVIEQDVSYELPNSLSAEVAFEINGGKINAIPFLRPCDNATKILLVTVLQPRVFMPSECVVREGDRGSDMYIIHRGTLQVSCSQVKGGPIRILSKGDFFGESCLLGSKTNRATVTALEYCDCFTLNKDDFNEVIDGSPLAQTIRVNLANAIMESQASNKRAFNNISRYPKCAQLMLGSNSDAKCLARTVPTLLLLPESPLYLIWNTFLLGICTYNAWIIPFRLAFGKTHEFIFVDWTFDVFYFLDMLLNYRCVAYFQEGEVVTDISKIKQHYMLNRFKMDLLSTFPFDIIAFFLIPKESWSLVIQDGLRVLKLFRLRRHFATTLDRIFSLLLDYHITLAPLRLAEFLLGVILLAHWAACGFFIFARWKHSHADCTEGSANCWEGTWIMRQIYNDKLPQDGGSIWQLYVRSLNWALPTLVVVVIGDVVPTTSPETLYALLWMLVGVTINASIVGNVANIVANLETDSSEFANAIDNIRNVLSVHHLSHDFHSRVDDFARYLWVAHDGITNEDDFILRLPHTLQTQIIADTRMRHVKACPFFHSLQNDVVETLALSMKQLVFCTGDIIVHAAEMGGEMFFLDRGTVRVVSPDHTTTYATLSEGAFFGEACLFFNKPRLTSVCAETFCDVFELQKDDLFNALKKRDIDLVQMRELFICIHEENERRNRSIAANLIHCKEPRSKLSKITGANIKATSNEHKVPKVFLPGTRFRFFWDVACTLCIIYLAVSVLYRIAFRIIDENGTVPIFDVLVDIFFIIDCFALRFTRFAFVEDGIMHQKKIDIIKHYKKNGMIPDVISSFAVLDIITHSYHFRLLSLAKVIRLPYFLDSLCAHLDERGIRVSLASNLLAKIFLFYVIACHQISCIWFIIHRYLERGKELTWATSDCPEGGKTGSDVCMAMWSDEIGQHNVCNMDSMNYCYIRAFHFSLTTLSTVGYGDISPGTELETIWELCVCLVGACFLAALIGAFGAYLQQNDTKGHNAFFAKIERLKEYMKFRNIPYDIQNSILFFHQTRWEISQTLDERETLSLLPRSLQLDISFAVKKKVIHMVPILETLPIIVQKRIAHALRPQVYAPRENPIIYNVGDIGWDVFFIAAGYVSISLPVDAKELDAAGRANWTSNKLKFDSTGLVLGPGSYIGESCLCSKSGVRQETVTAATRVEIYALCKDDFDDICRVMGPSQEKALKEGLLARATQPVLADETTQSMKEEKNEDNYPRRKKQRSVGRNALFPKTSANNNETQSDRVRKRRMSIPGSLDSITGSSFFANDNSL